MYDPKQKLWIFQFGLVGVQDFGFLPAVTFLTERTQTYSISVNSWLSYTTIITTSTLIKTNKLDCFWNSFTNRYILHRREKNFLTDVSDCSPSSECVKLLSICKIVSLETQTQHSNCDIYYFWNMFFLSRLNNKNVQSGIEINWVAHACW